MNFTSLKKRESEEKRKRRKKENIRKTAQVWRMVPVRSIWFYTLYTASFWLMPQFEDFSYLHLVLFTAFKPIIHCLFLSNLL